LSIGRSRPNRGRISAATPSSSSPKTIGQSGPPTTISQTPSTISATINLGYSD